MTQLPKDYLHSTQTRTPHEIQLTTNITKVLTQLNIARKSHPTVKKQNLLFLCITGLPSMDNQFLELNLPGEVVVKKYSGFEKEYTEAEYLELWKVFGLDQQAKDIHRLIEEKGKGKEIIFVYHSFGTFIALVYFHLYPMTKVKGIIELGGAPIRFHSLLKDQVNIVRETPEDFLLEEAETLYRGQLAYFQELKKKKIFFYPYKNKYETILFMRLVQSQWFKKMFEMSRNLPNVLKLFCFGSKDGIFQEKFLAEKSVHYCYKRKFQPAYEEKLKKKYEKAFGKKVKNIQERFVYNFEGASHALHMQNRYSSELQKAIGDYLEVISLEE